MIFSSKSFFLTICLMLMMAPSYFLSAQNPADLSGEYQIRVKQTGRTLHEDGGSDKLVSTRFQPNDNFTRFILERQSDNSYRVKVKASGRFWHVDSSKDKLLSTRFQTTDNHARFFFDPQSNGSFRIRLKATNRFIHVDGGSDKLASTRFQPNDDFTRFILVPTSPRSSLSILTYNVMFLNSLLFPNHQQIFRSQAIPRAINKSGSWDVVVFNEAFDDDSRNSLVRNMISIGYKHNTFLVDKSGNLENGGVFMMSRFPIEAQENMVFRAKTGEDGLSNKGAAYMRIVKNGKRVHVFGTHLQADDENSAVRARQISELRAFIDRKTAGRNNELIVIAGDLNFNVGSQEYRNNISSLGVTDFNAGAQFRTFDPQNNKLTKYRYPDESATLYDYIFVVNRGARPFSAQVAMHKFRTPQDFNIPAAGGLLASLFDKGTNLSDLSDHFALSTVFSY